MWRAIHNCRSCDGDNFLVEVEFLWRQTLTKRRSDQEGLSSRQSPCGDKGPLEDGLWSSNIDDLA